MVKAVVFDLGKVLVDFDYMVAARKVAARSKLSANEIMRFLGQSPSLFAYEKGQVSREEFFNEIRAATGFDGDLEEFGSYFADIFVAIDPMIQVQATLRQRGFPTYVFSNTNDLAVSHIRRNFPFFSNFDGYILSYEHGVMKPDPRLYAVVERQSGCRGAELLYLDDRSENTAAGAERGWDSILHETSEKSVSEIQKRGLLP